MGIWLDISVLATCPSVIAANTRLNWSTIGVDDIPVDCLVEVH